MHNHALNSINTWGQLSNRSERHGFDDYSLGGGPLRVGVAYVIVAAISAGPGAGAISIAGAAAGAAVAASAGLAAVAGIGAASGAAIGAAIGPATGASRARAEPSSAAKIRQRTAMKDTG